MGPRLRSPVLQRRTSTPARFMGTNSSPPTPRPCHPGPSTMTLISPHRVDCARNEYEEMNSEGPSIVDEGPSTLDEGLSELLDHNVTDEDDMLTNAMLCDMESDDKYVIISQDILTDDDEESEDETCDCTLGDNND